MCSCGLFFAVDGRPTTVDRRPSCHDYRKVGGWHLPLLMYTVYRQPSTDGGPTSNVFKEIKEFWEFL